MILSVGNFIWSDFYPSNANKIFPVVNSADPSGSFNYRWTTTKTRHGLSKKTVGIITITSSIAEDWYMDLRRKIIAATTVQKLEKNQKLLVILALKMLRYLINDAVAVENHILETATNLAKKLAKWNANSIIPPPNKDCANIKLFLEQRCEQTSTIFAMLTHAMLNESAVTYEMYTPIMLASCMLIFKHFGLGPFKWLFSAAKRHKINELELMEYFAIDPALDEYELMVKHLKDHENCKSWPYARLIDPEYFVGFNVFDNPRMTMIFVHLSKPKSDWDEIKKIKSLEKRLWFADFGRTLAEAFLRIKSKKENESGSESESE